MKQFIAGMLVAALALTVYACTTPGASGGASGNAVLFKVNGRGVTAEEFISSPYLRDAMRQYIFYEAMKSEANKAGAKVDEADFTKKMEEEKKNVELQMNMSWADFLDQNGLTEKEYTTRNRDRELFNKLNEIKVKVSDAEARKVWETDKENLVNQYIAQEKLPDSEKAKVTFEQVKELAEERVRMNKMMLVQGEIVADIVLNAELDMVAIKDPARQKQLEDLILNNSKEQAKKQKEDSQAQQKAAGMEVADDPAAAEGSAKDGKGVTASPEGGAAGEEVPHDHDGDGVSDHGEEAHAEGGEGETEEVPHDHDGDGVSDHGEEAHGEGGE
jgi:hypothetical protein